MSTLGAGRVRAVLGGWHRRAWIGTAVALALGGAACSAGDDGADDQQAAAEAEVTPTTTVAPPTVAPTIVTTTTVALPPLSERFQLIEVSALQTDGRSIASSPAQVLAVSASGRLAQLPDPGDASGAAAWCSGAGPAAAGAFVVRIVPAAVDASEGGLEAFELATEPGPDAVTGDAAVSASVMIERSGVQHRSTSAAVTVGEDPSTGTFRAELDDGSVLEGAYRCS